MKTNQKHFIIRKDLTSPIQALRYLGIFIDKWDYGLDLGNKQIIHCNNTIRMNGLIFNKNIKPRERNSYKINSRHIYDHMSGRKTYYFTSNPFSRYRLFVPDIDNKTNDKTRIFPFLTLFVSHFPDIFYDHGSSGKSLHPYLKLDMFPLHDYHLFESDDYKSYPKFANEILSQAGYILRIYGHNILAPEHTLVKDKRTGNIKSRYDVELDDIKGTYPDYQFFYSKKTGKYVITDVINHGVLVKLPRLVTPDDYKWFYSSRVYSILDLLSFVVYKGSSLLLSSFVDDEERTRVEQYLTSFETILTAHSVFPPSQEKNSVASSSSITEHGHSNSNYCLGKLRFKPKNKDFDNSKEYDGNANIRRIAIIQRLCREHYSENGIEPTDEYLEEQYRAHPASTGQADKADVREIKEVCRFVKNEFKPELAGGKPKYERFMFIKNIKQTFVKTDYKDILKDTSARKCRPKNVILDLYAGYAYTHLSRNKDLTLSTYDGFHKFLKKYKIEITDNTCLACRLLFEHYGWLEKIVADYEMPTYDHVDGKVVKQDGKAMAYTLTSQFPFYETFEKAVGKKNIDKVRTKGLASMLDWDGMSETA